METLEARLLLASVNWIADSDGFWDEAANWRDEANVSRVPGLLDDVVIERAAADPLITVRSGEQSVRSLMARERVALSGGSLAVEEPSELMSGISLDGGTFTVNGPSTLGGTSSWRSGTIAGNESLTNVGTLTLVGVGTMTLTGALVNSGQIVQSGGTLSLNGGTLTNAAGAVYDIQGDFGVSGSGSFANAGTLRKSAGAGTATIAVGVNNTGSIELESGTLSLSSGITQHVGSTLTGGTWIVDAGATLNFATGSNITTNQGNVTLRGNGSTFVKINSVATNAGTFSLEAGRDFTAVGSLANSGTLELGDGSDFIATANNASVTNTGTIRKVTGGTSALNTLTLTDQSGTIVAEDGTLSFPGSPANFQNTTFMAESGGMIDLRNCPKITYPFGARASLALQA